MKRSTWILLAVAAALLAVILLWERKAPTTDQREEDRQKVCELQVSKVTRLVRTGGGPVDLQKGPGGRWSLLQPVKDAGDKEGIEGFLERMAQAKALRFPQAGTPLAALGLDKPRATWDILTGQETTRVDVGAKAPFNEGLYLRVNGRLALVPADMESLLLRPADGFRLKNLTAAATQDVQAFTVNGPGGKSLACRRAGRGAGWDVTAPFQDWGADSKIESMLDDVSLCLVDTFVTGSVPDLKTAGLDPPRTRIRLEMAAGAPVDIGLGAPVPGADPRKRLVYASVSGRPSIMVVSQNSLASLDQDPEGLRSLKLFRRDAYEAAELDVEGPLKLVLIRGKEGAWQSKGSPAAKSVGSDLGAVPVALTNLEGEKAVPWDGARMPGFDPSQATFVLKGDGSTETAVVGAEKNGRRLAHPEGRPVALVLPGKGWATLDTALHVAAGSSEPPPSPRKAPTP